MEAALETYALDEVDSLVTPALLIYPAIVDCNIRTTLRMVGNDPERWRPHIKTAKLAAIVRRLIQHGVRNFKCSTTLELLTACEAGASDVLLAFAVTGANARRVVDIAREFPQTSVSVLIESSIQAAAWRDSGLGIFIDLNSGMNRTGLTGDAGAVLQLASETGLAFRGLHWYDGHVSNLDPMVREAQAYAGYHRLMTIVHSLEQAGLRCGEVITSGTPAAPYGYSYPGFTGAGFIHRISPGTVIYNDTTSLRQLAGFPYQAAALVLSTVISHPLPAQITCDAGHKSVSADAGVPTCTVIGRPALKPLKPSEEHLPIECSDAGNVPPIGGKLYLLPRHVCPTVNNFDEALMIVNGRVAGVERVTARGHENPLVLAASRTAPPIGAFAPLA